VDDERS